MLRLGAAALLLSLAVGCTPFGIIYSKVTAPPQDMPLNNSGPRVFEATGRACATSIFGLFAIGDMSQKAAAEAAGITKIHAVDEERMGFAFLYRQHCTLVSGEVGRSKKKKRRRRSKKPAAAKVEKAPAQAQTPETETPETETPETETPKAAPAEAEKAATDEASPAPSPAPTPVKGAFDALKTEEEKRGGTRAEEAEDDKTGEAEVE